MAEIEGHPMNFPPANYRGEGAVLVSLRTFLLIAVLSISFSIAVSSIAFGLASVLMLFHFIRSGSPARFRTPLDWFILAYCLTEALSTAFSIDRATSFFFMKRLFLILYMYMVCAGLDTERRVRTALALLIGVTALFSAGESLRLLLPGHVNERLGVFQHYMTAGGIKMIVLLMALPFVLDAGVPRRWRIWAIVCALPTLLALILTETRSSWLGFAGGTLTYGFLRNRKILLIFLLLVVVFMIVAPSPLQQRAWSIVDLTHPSNVDRLWRWAAGWKMFLDYPILGTGDIDFGIIYPHYKLPEDPQMGGHLHNNLLQFLVTLGVVGFAVVMVLFVKIFLVELKAVKASSGDWLYSGAAMGALASYVGFHINGLFEWNFGDHEIAVLLWFTIGLAMVAYARYVPAERGPSP